MAALAAKAMGAVPAKEKQALLEARRQQAKKAKSSLVGTSSRAATTSVQSGDAKPDVECIPVVDGNTKEGTLGRSDGAMEESVGRLALQASSSIGGIGGVSAERAVGNDFYEASESKFCIRQYTEIVRQDRGDFKRSWPLAEEYLRGHIVQGRVQVSLWPRIDAGDSALSHASRSPFYTPDVPLPHLFKLETAFAESGVAEDRSEQSWITAEEVKVEKRFGAHLTFSSVLVERRPSEEGSCITRTKSFKAGRKLSATTECTGDGEAQGRWEKQDRVIRHSEAKHVEQEAAVLTGSQRTASTTNAKGIDCVIERGVIKQVREDATTIQVNAAESLNAEPGVNVGTGKGKRSSDPTHYHAFQEKRTVDNSSKAQVLVEKVAEIGERVLGVGKGKACLAAEVGGPSNIRTDTLIADSDRNPRLGEREVPDGLVLEKETTVTLRRRNEDDRIIEERSSKSDGPSASRPSTKRQSNKSCPVCRSFSSMSQTTMNVHIDSCLVEHRQEENVADADPVESEPEPSREPSREPPARSKPLKSKGPGVKPKRKKRSIADIVANSVSRTLEESPGEVSARLPGPHCRSIDQVHDSKNLNWVSGNKKKRQPRNVPSRSLKEENDGKRRRISRTESAAEELKPAKQEKRRLPEKEREGTTKPKQLRVERSTGPSTSLTKSSKVQDGGEAESRRSGARKSGATPASHSPGSRAGPGKGHVIHSNKESNGRGESEFVGLSQARETRTSAQEDLHLEADNIPAKNLDITSPRKSPPSVQKNPAPTAAKARAAKVHLNSVTAGRQTSPVPATDRAAKAPWYPPAAMLRSGTTRPAIATEPAGSTPIPEIACGTTKSPGSSLTAENLPDASRTVPSADTSVSTRKSPRSTTVNSNKGRKSSRSLEGESPFTILTNDEVRGSSGEPSHKTRAHGDVQSMAECRKPKEVDDSSDPTGTAVEGMEHSVSCLGGVRAVSVELPHQPSSTEAKKYLSSEKGGADEDVGKSEGVIDSEKQKPASDKVRRREERRGSMLAEEESGTASASEVDLAELDQDPSVRIVQEDCKPDACGDTQTVFVGAEKAREPAGSRMRKRGGAKGKARNFHEKTNGKGKRASEGNADQGDEDNIKHSLPNSNASEETSTEGNQRKENKLKEEQQWKEQQLHAMGATVEPTVKFSTDPVQPAFQDMVVRRIEGVMEQEKEVEQMLVRVAGHERGVELVISNISNVASPTIDEEKRKEGQANPAQFQANSTYKLQLQRPEETLNNMAQQRFGRNREVSTSSFQTKEVTSQVDDDGANAQMAKEDVVQSQYPQTWSLVPQRPVGRKKLPIKCAARSVGSANAVGTAAQLASSNSSNNNAINQAAMSVEIAEREGPEKVSSRGDIRAANNNTVPKPPVSRSRAARQLAKSLPGGKKGASHGVVLSPEGLPLISSSAAADANAERSDYVGSTSISPSQQALLSPSSSWVTNPVRGQPSMNTRPERVSAEMCTSKNETLFGSPQSNTELNTHVRTSKEATTDQIRDKGSSIAELPEDTETGTNFQEKNSGELDGSFSRLPVSRQQECGFSVQRRPEQIGIGKTGPGTTVQELNEKDSTESVRACEPENSLSAIFRTNVGEAVGSGKSGLSTGKVAEAPGNCKPDTPDPFQSLQAGLTTFSTNRGNTNIRLGAVIPTVASVSIGMDTQLAQGRPKKSIPAAVASTRVSSYRLNTATADAGSFQVGNDRAVMTTTAPLPTSFTSLLQSTGLPPQSSAALSLAMQGTRPLQEACVDRNELSRAGTDPVRRTLDGLTWVSEKHAPGGNDDVPAGTAFFRPPAEMGGPSKGSEAGDAEVSRLPGWMRAAISDPKGSEPGTLVTTEAESTLKEEVKGLTDSPESGEISGSVRVRLWGRDVVVPPHEKSTTGTLPTRQVAYCHRSEEQREAVTGRETVASSRTSTACLNGITVNSQAGLKVPPRTGQGVAETNVPAMTTANSESGVLASTEAASVSSKANDHQFENYLSRLGYNNQRPLYTANSREEIRSSRASKGQASAVQSITPPEVIIIDDSAESPAKSGDSISGEGLTMAFLFDCGALRYLPATQNSRSGSQLMEVDPSKIPQRLANQNFNILAELRKIGLVPAPKAVLPASYRHTHSLSLEVPHSTPSSASKAGSDVLPPWLLAEKKRKEAQIAENLIVLDDDDEPPTGTVILGERRPLNSRASPGGSSNFSEKPNSTGQISSSMLGKSGSEIRVIEHSPGASRTSATSSGATGIPARHSSTMSHAGGHFRRGASSSPRGNEPSAAQKNISRKNDHTLGNLIKPAVDKDHLNANTASESLMREKDGLQSLAAASKEHLVGVQTSSGPSPTPRRQRGDNRTEKEKQIQVIDLQIEKKTSRAGAGAHKSGPPGATVGGQDGLLSKKGRGQGISILASTWMSGNNGWHKRGAAAQACKQAVERLKAQILSSPARDGTSQAGPGGLLDFESHMSGQAQDKITKFGGNSSNAASCPQNVSTQATQGGFRYSTLSSRNVGDHENMCGSKEAPHSGRGVGQSPTPGAFTSAVVAAERDVSTASKSPCVPSVAVNSTAGVQGGTQGMEANQGRSFNPGSKTPAPSGPNVLEGKMSNLVAQSTLMRETSTSEQSSPTFSHLGRSSSSSPTHTSRTAVGSKAVNEAGSTNLARATMQSKHGSLLPAQGTPFSRLRISRLSPPVHGSIPTLSTQALLEQVCFTNQATADSFTRDVSTLHATMEQQTRRMTSPHKRMQPSRSKNIAPVSCGETTIITSRSSARSRPAPGFPSLSPPTSTTDQRKQPESGVIGALNMSDGTPVVRGLNVSGKGTPRRPASDLSLSSVFGRLSQTSNSSPSSSQGRYTVSCTTINPCDGGTWTLPGQTDAGEQGSGTGLSERSPGSGIIPGYRLSSQIEGALVGHTQRPRATNSSTAVSDGFFASVERASQQKESDSSPRSRDSDCIAVSVHERYSHTRSTGEEKMKEAQRESPKFTTTETAEKIRTKSLNSI